jgi:ribokinase
VAAARLGARVAFIGRLGADARGDALLAALGAEGVGTQFVLQDHDAATGVALIQVDRQGEKQIMTAPGANRRLTVADVEAARALFEGTRVFLTQLEIPLDCTYAAMRLAQAVGARVVLDPAPAVPLSDDLLGLVDVIRPNADEASLLTGVQVRDADSARVAARQLMGRGAGAVVVQARDEGNLLVWPGGERLLPRLPVLSVDATGAGDALAAALAVALAEGAPLDVAGPFANAAAALATTVIGAQAGLPTREAVLDLLVQHGNGREAQGMRGLGRL